MNRTPELRDQIALTYLQHLQELAAEISVASEAIAANALPELQESVSKQELLCANLASMTPRINEALRLSKPPALSSTDSGIESKIRAAALELRELNLKYEALLKHSGKSIAMLALLCKSCTGSFQEGSEARWSHQTWSCEV